MTPAVRAIILGGLDPDAVAWRKTVTVSSARLALVSKTIKSLKAAGVWPSLDRLWLFAAENAMQGRTCLKTRNLASPTNGPTFTINRGYTGDGISSYVDSNFNTSTAGGNYTQNDGMLSAWVVTGGSPSGGAVIGNNNSAYSQIIPNGGASNRRMTVNSTTLDAAYAATVFVGHFLSQRTGASAVSNFLNGVSENTNVTASTALVNQNTIVLANISSGGTVNQYSDAQLGMAAIGKSLAGKEAAFYSALRTHLTAIGVP